MQAAGSTHNSRRANDDDGGLAPSGSRGTLLPRAAWRRRRANQTVFRTAVARLRVDGGLSIVVTFPSARSPDNDVDDHGRPAVTKLGRHEFVLSREAAVSSVQRPGVMPYARLN